MTPSYILFVHTTILSLFSQIENEEQILLSIHFLSFGAQAIHSSVFLEGRNFH
jgi:hypothetical protein